MSKPHLIAYISNWHQNKSPAFHKVLAEPLADLLEIEFRPEQDYDPDSQDCPIVFCQRITLEKLPETAKYPISWIPMADVYPLHQLKFWSKVPEYLRIITFSELLRGLVQQAGLPLFHTQFFFNPDDFPPVDWSSGIRLMYWNRVKLIGESALLKLCDDLHVDDLLFRASIDATIFEVDNYKPDSRDDKMTIQILENIDSQEDYLQILQQVNVYLAPRAVEGIGLSFLEAMASGCAVIAVDFTTMNEYIQHNHNGILLPYHVDRVDARRKRFILRSQLTKRGFLGRTASELIKRIPHGSLLDANDLDSDYLRAVNLKQLGNNAREHHYEGYQHWQSRLADLAHFLVSP